MTTPLFIGYGLWAAFVISWHVSGARSPKPVMRAGSDRARAFGLAIALGWTLIVLPPGKDIVPKLWTNPPWLEWTMLGVIVAGFAFCWWARLHLGRLWSADVVHKDGHRVVESGPYGLVRHPIYTGFLVSYFGLAVISTTPTAFLAVAFFTLGLWLKARVEEQFLSEELGAKAYASYQSRTPMLVPRLSRPEESR